MRINTLQLAKRFRHDWILRDVNLHFDSAQAYAITGPNGTGKSTLLKLLSGHLSPSRGKVEYVSDNQIISHSDRYHYVAYAAPYIELIEEFTLLEAIRFHHKFAPFPPALTTDKLIDLLNFQRATHKQIRHFSSGMKQRLKLALAICSDKPILLLDEPSTNLDRQGLEWFLHLLDAHKKNRLILIASNVPDDLSPCTHAIDILDLKKG